MRTTISLSDELAREVRRGAAARGLSVSAFIESLIRASLHAQEARSTALPFRLITFDGGGVQDGVQLDRAARELDQEDAASLLKAGR